MLFRSTVSVGTEPVPAAGLFVFTGRKPATDFLYGLLDCNGGGYILIKDGGLTSVPGIFACGDVTVADDRIATAIAAGEQAGHNAVEWVRNM